jgi:hypothetical protein
MKILMSNSLKTYGLVVPDDEKVTKLGQYKLDLLVKSIEYCLALFKLEDDRECHETSIRIGFLEKNGCTSLILQPKNFVGDAWIAVAPLVEEES